MASTVVDGRTVEDAVSKLDWRDGDLIMVGSSRLSAPKRLFLGSTAAKMLRVLDVPMVVVPRDQIDGDALPTKEGAWSARQVTNGLCCHASRVHILMACLSQ